MKLGYCKSKSKNVAWPYRAEFGKMWNVVYWITLLLEKGLLLSSFSKPLGVVKRVHICNS
jgi:hypothetical protein